MHTGHVVVPISDDAPASFRVGRTDGDERATRIFDGAIPMRQDRDE